MSKRIAVVGGGVNGLVAANYLARAGRAVTLYERHERVGGACISESVNVDGIDYEIPLGATVLGFMQDFVFEETGLASRLETWAPAHSKLVYFPGSIEPTYIHRDPAALERELRDKCDERGDIAGFRRDEAHVVSFLQDGYRRATPPRLEDARARLGEAICERFIEGSARALMDHYFTSERTKLYMSMTVIESGPVSLDAPFSAFNVPLLDSGSVFGGYYGFVKGGIWQITEELARINSELGVRIETSSEIDSIDSLEADTIVLATDPATAARLSGQTLPSTSFLGTAGKMTLLFRNPVRWKDSPEADTAFRFIFLNDSLDAMEQAAQRVVSETDFEPGYIQLYADGAGMRHMGLDEPFERVIAFFKNVRFAKQGNELPEVERYVKETMLAKIANPEDLAWSMMLTPADLKERFLFPEGNVDHTMLTGEQSFSNRHFSPNPEESFYQFGANENVYYCGAGGYPCGSIAGTTGYMCAQQILSGTSDL
jgi:phytoene dehydrogenase-like protein